MDTDFLAKTKRRGAENAEKRKNFLTTKYTKHTKLERIQFNSKERKERIKISLPFSLPGRG